MKRKLLVVLTVLIVPLSIPLPMAMAGPIEDKVAVCTGCHGPQGHSQVPENPILAAQHPGYLEAALQAYINGERDYGIMKTLAGRLTAEDIKAISAHFAAQPPARSQAKAPGDAVRGKARTAVCAACHGPDGNSVAPANPNLAGQHATYLSNALKAYKSGSRTHVIMTSMVAALSDQDIEDIAAYYAAQSIRPPSAGVHEPTRLALNTESPAHLQKEFRLFAQTATPQASAAKPTMSGGKSR